MSGSWVRVPLSPLTEDVQQMLFITKNFMGKLISLLKWLQGLLGVDAALSLRRKVIPNQPGSNPGGAAKLKQLKCNSII